VQVLGAVCVWTGPSLLSALGPVLFITGLVLLAPGGLLSLMLVEKLLWNSRLTLSGMTWVEFVLTLTLNAANRDLSIHAQIRQTRYFSSGSQ
jgi:hypothetical protein